MLTEDSGTYTVAEYERKSVKLVQKLRTVNTWPIGPGHSVFVLV